MKMLLITDGHTYKTTHLASQKVNLAYMREGVYPLELAERWITHGSSRKACLNPALYRDNQITVGIVFESIFEREVITRATSKAMRDKLRKCDFGENASSHMQYKITNMFNDVKSKDNKQEAQPPHNKLSDDLHQRLRQLLGMPAE